jgi:hypothetical protein
MVLFVACTAACGLIGPTLAAETKPIINPSPTAQEYADLAKLPDWSGVWNPVISDQDRRIRTDPTPWNEKAAAEVAQMFAEEKAGKPRPLFVECLPEGMPAWMLVTHNALEFLYTPGRVTILGESDGNRLRRIYTDGRPHPEEPDPTFHGHSIHLAGNDYLHDDLEIIAPKILTKPWKTTRVFTRQRARKFDIVEGVCLQGSFSDAVDSDGNAAFVPVPHQPWGNLVAPK